MQLDSEATGGDEHVGILYAGGETTNGHRRILYLFLALALFSMACDLSTLTSAFLPTPIPTAVPGMVNTIIAQTAAAAATQTAALSTPTSTATLTPSPTRTPSETPSPSPTFLFILPTRSKTPTPGNSSSDFACQLLDQTPADGSTVEAGAAFQVKWTVKNIGASTWDSNAVDFNYVSGEKLSKLKAADLPQSVGRGGTVDLMLNMTAPNDSGTHKTVWSLVTAKTNFCRLTLSIVVK